MSTNSQPYPSDPADLFLTLYAELDERCASDGRASDWLVDDQVQDIASYVEDQAFLAGEFDPEAVEEALDLADDADQRRYAYLLGLDRALGAVHPAADAAERGRLVHIASRYRMHGRMNSQSDDGALLPRFVRPRRLTMMSSPPTETKADLFENVTCVSTEHWAQVAPGRVPRDADVPAAARWLGLTIGCAPVARLSDVDISVHEGHRREYSVQPLSSLEMTERIKLIVRRLDERNVAIALMPELTLNADGLATWQAALAEPPPRGSRLRMLMVGTGPLVADSKGRWANRAVLLSRRGDVLLVQDKRYGFSLSREQIQDWCLTEQLDGDDPCAEPISPGQSLSVLESSVGRLCVMICEDLGRVAEDGRLLMEIGPSHLLAPVLSKPTLRHFWEHSDAKKWASEIGSDTVVSNSLIVEDAMRACGRLGDQLGTAIGHSGTGEHEVGYASEPDEIVAFRFAYDRVVNAVHVDRLG